VTLTVVLFGMWSNVLGSNVIVPNVTKFEAKVETNFKNLKLNFKLIFPSFFSL